MSHLMLTTVQERAKAMLGEREVRAWDGHPGWLLIEGTPVRGEAVWHKMNPTAGVCGCKAYQTSDPEKKGCKHLRLLQAALPIHRAFNEAGVQ